MKLNHDFWQTVQRDFVTRAEAHLCNASPTFECAWNDAQLRDTIIKRAAQFSHKFPLKDFRITYCPTIGSPLFVYSGAFHYIAAREIRLAFLSYMIKQTRTTPSNEHKTAP